VPATCACTDPEQSSPCSPTALPEDRHMPSVCFISVSHYLSAICSVCSELYCDIRSMQISQHTILTNFTSSPARGGERYISAGIRESLQLHIDFNINLGIIFIHT
jgi:hypothetical protein